MNENIVVRPFGCLKVIAHCTLFVLALVGVAWVATKLLGSLVIGILASIGLFLITAFVVVAAFGGEDE